jgi:hypothetical protein
VMARADDDPVVGFFRERHERTIPAGTRPRNCVARNAPGNSDQVIPVQAGIQLTLSALGLDSRVRGNDGNIQSPIKSSPRSRGSG